MGGEVWRGAMIEVRRLAPGDLKAYRELHRLGLEEGASAFVESVAEDEARPDSEVAAMLQRGEAWGAFNEGRLVAKLTIDHVPYAMLAHTRWLHAMYARPETRGTGAAAALVRAAIADAREAGAIRFMLWVNAENPRARRFYESLGFDERGRIPGGIRIDGRLTDDVMMCLGA